jgi:diguanylate cyclase (GGDEF)-like protein/PAS domain S-box-containing protein
LERGSGDSNAFASVVLGAYGAGFLIWTLLGGPPGAGKAAMSDVAAIPAGVLATFLALRASRTPGIDTGSARAWRGLGLACVAYLVGDLLWLLYEVVLETSPSPSPASLFYLAYYPLFLFGLLRFPTVLKDRSRRVEFWLDATIVLVGGSLVVWHFVLGPAAAVGPGSSLDSALNLAYPVGDLVLLLTAAVTVLSRLRNPDRPAFLWLVAGLLLEFAADLVQGTNALQGLVVGGGLADGLFLAHWVGFGLAADSYRRRTLAPEEAVDVGQGAPSAFNLSPYAAAVVGYSVLAVAMRGQWGTEIGGLVGGAIALTAVVLVRQAVAERANLRLRGEQAARQSEARFRALVQHASDVIVVVDEARRMKYLSPSLERVLGLRAADFQDQPLAVLIDPGDQTRSSDLLAEACRRPGPAGPAGFRVRQADGSGRSMEVTAQDLLAEPDIQGIVLTLRDVHERKHLEDRLTHLAFHDPLTGLANRALLTDRLGHSLARARREGHPLSLLFFDLDHFKAVNDGLGHGAGDRVLCEVAHRLSGGLRTTDTAARVGGDEFAVLLEDTDAAGATLVAERLVVALQAPIALEEGDKAVSASVGIAVSHGGSEAPAELLRNADVAMYEAKQSGRNRCLLFEPSQHAAVLERLELENDLRRAIERAELELVYQPIVALESGAMDGAEALVRWRHPVRGRLGPGDFVPLAEEREIIVPIGRWVLAEACRRARGWKPGAGLGYVSVNLSGRQLQDPGFVEDVHKALDLSGLPASRLVLEITESFSLLETRAVVGRLHDLKDLGVRLAIDDFGTGYSSLSYLQTLPMSVLKIDRAFVAASGPRAAPVLRGIVELGKAMGMALVAEGVETAEQVATLRALGCEHGQGFLFARPMEGEQIDQLMAEGATLPLRTTEA